MTATEAQKQQASDPNATGVELKALIAEPELWPLIAANPSTYPGLLEYLREHGGPEVHAALAARDGAESVAEESAEAVEDAVAPVEEADSPVEDALEDVASPVEAEAPAQPAPAVVTTPPPPVVTTPPPPVVTTPPPPVAASASAAPTVPVPPVPAPPVPAAPIAYPAYTPAGTPAAPAAPGAYPAYASTAAAAPRAPRNRKPLVITLVIVGILALLGAAIGITIPVLNSTVFNPENVAKQFLEHIAKGEFQAATQMTTATVENSGDYDLSLTATPSVQLVTGLTDIKFGTQISDPLGSGSVSLPVTAKLGEETVSGTIVLAPADTVALVFKNWKIVATTFASGISVSADGATEVTIGGVPITLDDDGYATVAAFPGVYGYTASTTSPYFSFEGESEQITVGGDSGIGSLYLEAKPSEALVSDVSASAKEQVDTCIDEEGTYCYYLWSGESSPDGCSYAPSPDYPQWYRNIVIDIDSYPNVTTEVYSISNGGYATTDSGDEGSASVTWEELDFSTNAWVSCSMDASVEFNNTFTFDGDSIVFDDYLS